MASSFHADERVVYREFSGLGVVYKLTNYGRIIQEYPAGPARSTFSANEEGHSGTATKELTKPRDKKSSVTDKNLVVMVSQFMSGNPVHCGQSVSDLLLAAFESTL